MQFTQPLPPGVTPQISPESPTGEIYRYTLRSPKDGAGNDLYTLNDLKALQDWVLEREFRRVPRIVDVSSSGGMVKRYEIHPDPNRLRRYGITLAQVQQAIVNANANVGGDYLKQGDVALNIRGFGLFGGGLDPAQQVLGMDKVVLDAYRDVCLAEALGVITSQDRFMWQQLAERRFAATWETPPPPESHLPPQQCDRLNLLDRLRQAADDQQVTPPLSDKEKEQVDALRNLRDAVAKQSEHGFLTRLRGSVLGSKETLSLNSSELGLVDAARRIIAGFSSREVKPPPGPPRLFQTKAKPLNESEKEVVEGLRRWVATRASARLRQEEARRLLEMRKLVITSVNNTPILLEDIVMGGRLTPPIANDTHLQPGDVARVLGAVASWSATRRAGRVGLTKPYAFPPGYTPKYSVLGTFDLKNPFNLPDGRTAEPEARPLLRNEDDKVQCIVLLRKGEDSLPALKDVREKIEELNDPDHRDECCPASRSSRITIAPT